MKIAPAKKNRKILTMKENTKEKETVRFIFFGTPEFSTIVLDELKEAGYLPSLIVTAADKPVGRKQILTPPPVKLWAEEHGIPYLQEEDMNALTEVLRSRDDDLYIVASFGKILPQKLLDLPKHGVLNVHTSLLPKYRGASPIECAIRNGDEKTGSTIMKMVFKMDAGPIVAQEEYPLRDDVTKPELFDELAHHGGKLLAHTLLPYLRGELPLREQDESQATYCPRLKKADGDITHDDDLTRWRKYRAYLGWPGVFFFDENGKRVKVTRARYENGKFIIERIIPEGKKEMEYRK